MATVQLRSIPGEIARDRPMWADLHGRRNGRATGRISRDRRYMSPPEPEPDVPVERMATSDRDGKFAFADLTPGCYRLVAKVSGLARVQGLCTLREKRRVCEITLIAVPGVEFGGIVLDEDKRPVTGAEVEGHTDQGGYAKTTTDGSGRFHLVLGASYPERAVFSARADGYLPEHAPALSL